MTRRHLDDIIIEISSILITCCDDTKDGTIAGFDFLDIGCGLVSEDSLQIQYYRWHIWTDECERTMLQLSR